MANHYLLCAFGPDRTGIVEELSACILRNRFNIADSRMTLLGDHFSMLLLVSGNASDIDGFSRSAAVIKNLTVQIKDVQPRPLTRDLFEYSVRIMGADTPGLVNSVTRYLKEQGTNVASLESWVTHAPHSGTEIFNMHIVVEVPKSVSFKEFKEGLIQRCDSMNLEVDIEPFSRG